MRFVSLFVLLFSFSFSFGQNFLSWKFSDRYFSASVGTGSATYFGDITTKFQGTPTILNVGLEARLLTHLSVRIEGSRYSLRAKDAWAEEGSFARQRNHSFESKNWEGNFQVIYYLKPYAGDYYRRAQWDPYIGTGVGLTSYFPTKELRGETYFLKRIDTEPDQKYGYTALVVPITAGVKFKVNDFTNLNFELGYRLTTTDYLDDVAGVYPTVDEDNTILEDLANPKDLIPLQNQGAYDLLIPGAPRGNDRKTDGYLFAMLKLEFFIPKDFLSRSKK